ncbi:MAG: glycosyltransferase, partial [Synechococcaceae cyanobacterium]|nr:glycosyltransferase [Synechococcaceae cyanobacterium]
LPDYDQDRDYLARMLPGVRIVYVPVRSRARSAAQTPVRKLRRFAEFTARAVSAARDEQKDILVGHDMPAMLPLLPWLLRRRIPVVYNAHELWSEAAEDNAPLRGAWRRLERLVCRRAARVVVPESNRADIVHREYGAPLLPVLVRNIPPNPPPFAPSDMLRERFGLDGEAVLVLYQGLFAPTRCLLPLLDAFRHLPASYHLVLAGEGDPVYTGEVLQRAEALPGRVHRLPWTPPDELRAVTASADIGVLLYSRDGRNNIFAAPNKLYEYLFAGLPLVSSAFPGLQSVIEDGGYGACAEPEDAQSIAAAIVRAAAMPSGKLPAARARAEFRWEDEVWRLAELYRELLRRRHAH